MTDYDLPAAPHERTPLLVRRCLAYAGACLREAREEFGDGQVKAYVSLSFADTEEGLLTSNVTFCPPLPDVRPYIVDLERDGRGCRGGLCGGLLPGVGALVRMLVSQVCRRGGCRCLSAILRPVLSALR
ncbi:hypothetical protein ACN24M_22265 [Streptomyces microflavus]